MSLASTLGVLREQEGDSSRPPDAAIRANLKIMEMGWAVMGRLMGAAPSGLNIVLSGSNPDAIRPPQRISKLNGEDLAALGNRIEAAAGGSSDPTHPSAEEAAPAPETPTAPTPQPPEGPKEETAPLPPPSSQDADPDKIITLKEVNIGPSPKDSDPDEPIMLKEVNIGPSSKEEG